MYTIEHTTYYKDDGRSHTAWSCKQMTYREAISELAYIRKLYQATCKETRFGQSDYGYTSKYANNLFKLIQV